MTGYFLHHEGRRLPVYHMFDIAGDLTDDPTEAFSAVAELPSGGWLATEVQPQDFTKQAEG